MSTRCNVVLTETYTYHNSRKKPITTTNRLYYYRHCDGYPETVLPILQKMLTWMKQGLIRSGVQQGGGWLLLLGAIEYNRIPAFKTVDAGGTLYGDINSVADPSDWQVGAFEVTDALHGDIEYSYYLDMTAKSIRVYKYNYTNDGTAVPVDITDRALAEEASE